MSKKKLAYYIENYTYGGLEKMVESLLVDPRLDEYRIIFYYNTNYQRFVDEFKAGNPIEKVELRPLKIFPLKKGRRYILFIYHFLYLLFKLERVDIFHAVNGGYPAADSCRAAVMAAKIKGSPAIILSVLSLAYERERFAAMIERAIDKLVEASVTCFHANSRAAGNSLTAMRGFKAEKIAVIHTAIDVSPDSKRKTVNYNNNHITIGTLAVLMHYKGHKYALDAVKIVQDHYGNKKEFEYLIIGSGDYRDHLEEYARKIGIYERCRFYGRHTGPKDGILKVTDIFVYPSLLDSLPYAVLEAMYAGLPIIATTTGGIPEQIIDRSSGILVPPADSRAIADGIIQLVDNPELMEEYGANAYKRVCEEFNVDSMVEKFDNLYRKTYAES